MNGGQAGNGSVATDQTIVDFAACDERFDTLVLALTDAGLADDLRGEGPFTVFAPTDEAFHRLPEGLLESLDSSALSDILLYPVVSRAVEPSIAVTMETADTLLRGSYRSLLPGARTAASWRRPMPATKRNDRERPRLREISKRLADTCNRNG